MVQQGGKQSGGGNLSVCHKRQSVVNHPPREIIDETGDKEDGASYRDVEIEIAAPVPPAFPELTQPKNR
jgi:hypothetical protein